MTHPERKTLVLLEFHQGQH